LAELFYKISLTVVDVIPN